MHNNYTAGIVSVQLLPHLTIEVKVRVVSEVHNGGRIGCSRVFHGYFIAVVQRISHL